MLVYILRRLLVTVPLLLFLSMVTFGLALLMPGDYIIATRPIEASQSTTRQTYDHLRELYGLDKSPVRQYLEWMRQVLKGNLGYSLFYGVSVRERVAERLPRTLELTGTGLAIGVIFGVTLGVIAALKEGSWFDHVFTIATFTWVSIPGFVLALMSLYFFSLKIPLFPTGGLGPIGVESGFWTRLHYLILPALMLGLAYGAQFAIFARGSLLETLRQDYVRTARAKGLSERMVTVRHALRNALIPLVTVMALAVPGLFSGATLIEIVFNWPGLGIMLAEAVAQRDSPMIVGMNLIIAALVLLSNLLADVLYGVVDPRIRY